MYVRIHYVRISPVLHVTYVRTYCVHVVKAQAKVVALCRCGLRTLGLIYSSTIMEVKELSINEVRLWSVDRLKDFLRKRGLKVSFRKDELVAIVFAAMNYTLSLGPNRM